MPLRRQVGDRGGEATELINIGLAFANAGESKKAEEYYTEAIAIVHTLGEPQS